MVNLLMSVRTKLDPQRLVTSQNVDVPMTNSIGEKNIQLTFSGDVRLNDVKMLSNIVYAGEKDLFCKRPINKYLSLPVNTQ